jgi:site-specific DNA-methyltransferase (adenine-specific)
LFRISKNQIVWGGNYFTDHLPPSAGWFIWDKNQPFDFSMAHAELAYTSFNRAIRTYKVKRNEHMNCVSNNKKLALINAKIHQCQKPIKIYDILYSLYADKTMKVIDTHGGSFSSAISAYYFGFTEYVGIEIDTDHFNNAVKRFKELKLSQLIEFNEMEVLNYE